MYTELVEGELHQVTYDEDEEDNQMKIVFMGTPDFAVPSLHALAEAGYEVAGSSDPAGQTKGQR